MHIGPWEVLVILLIILLLFGAKRIPDIAKAIGKGIQELKKGMHEIDPSQDNPPKKDETKDERLP